MGLGPARHLAERAAAGLAPGCNGHKELAVLQFDAVYRHHDLVNIDLLFLATQEIVITRQVGVSVADVAEVGVQCAVVSKLKESVQIAAPDGPNV